MESSTYLYVFWLQTLEGLVKLTSRLPRPLNLAHTLLLLKLNRYMDTVRCFTLGGEVTVTTTENKPSIM